MNDHKLLACEFKLVAVAKLLATHGADFVIHQNLLLLDQLLGFAAGVNQVCKLQGILQLDELGMDGQLLDIFLLSNNNFHNKSPFISLPLEGKVARRSRDG